MTSEIENLAGNRRPRRPACEPGWPSGSTGASAQVTWYFSCLVISILLFMGCGSKSAPSSGDGDGESAVNVGADAESRGQELVRRSSEPGRWKDSSITIRATITDDPGQSSATVVFTIHRRSQPGGGETLLVEFTDPPVERDRSALVSVNPQGGIRGTRYVQGEDSFVTTDSVIGEESLFGLTLQELAGGQPEKYAHTLTGEEFLGETPVYRVEGRLRDEAESKFHGVSMLIDKDSLGVLETEFRDKKGRPVRRMAVHRVELIDGHRTTTSWTIENLARRKTIRFEAIGVKYDQGLDDSFFTRERLKRFASR